MKRSAFHFSNRIKSLAIVIQASQNNPFRDFFEKTKKGFLLCALKGENVPTQGALPPYYCNIM